jgi:acetylornithine deacetylase/succinyl-diaminopimelate desuccinylase-like protein
LRGDGSKKAVVFLNHMDVVPADPKQWKEPPFSGLIKDGQIWGRGALDDKGPAVVELMTLLAFKRQNFRLKGDVIFLGTADEEAGGAMGAGYLLEKHPELFVNAGLVLNEGGGIRLGKDGKAREYSVSVAEKTPLWLRLIARGQPGHGSTPGNNLAVNKLLAALQRVTQYRAPIKVVPEVQKFYAETASAAPAERRTKYLDLRASLQDPAFADEFAKDPRNDASVRNTIAITVIKASEKTNVIPAEAMAELDVRLLPGEDPQEFIRQLRKIIGDDSIKVEVILSFPPATSPPHPEAMGVIAEMAKINDGGVPVVSPLVRGFTDCHFFRAKGIPCFGFMPLRNSPLEGGMVHGIDERITIESLRAGLRGMYELVYKLAVQ